MQCRPTGGVGYALFFTPLVSFRLPPSPFHLDYRPAGADAAVTMRIDQHIEGAALLGQIEGDRHAAVRAGNC